jgi:protein-S-isoprenylcysteine O-methyltransferase Ste14
MEKNLKDSPVISIPPPIFFFICLGFGLLLEHFSPIHLMSISPIPRVIVGGIFMVVSGYFAASAFFILIKNKTPFNTTKPTIKIVTDGAYRFSRNPLYFSLLLLLFGIAVLMSSLWLLFTIPILYFLFLFKAVKPEERYLSQKFGEEYLEYSAKVRRWI